MRHVFTTTVKPGKIEKYLEYHDNIWPEVAAGLRQAGVTQLHIYRVPNTDRLVLTIETAGVDLGEATGPGSLYRTDPKCEEWETMMDADFHGGWTELTRVHSSDVEWNKALALPIESRFYVTQPTDRTATLGVAATPGPASNPTLAEWSAPSFAAGVLCGAALLGIGARFLSK